MPHAPKHQPPKLPKLPKKTAEETAIAAAEKKIAEAEKKEAEKLGSKLLREMPLTPLHSYKIASDEEMSAAFTEYQTSGLVAIDFFESAAQKEDYCERASTSIWNETFGACQFKPEINSAVPYIKTAEDLAAIRGPGFAESARGKSLREAAGDSPTPHANFGATCFGVSFNLKVAHEIRSNHRLAEFAQMAMGPNSNVHYTIDRAINKLPNKGGKEFMHVDEQPFHESWTDETKRLVKVMHGKMVVSEGGTFIACPGSHLESGEITRLYKPLYPKASGMKFQLDPTREDPLNIYGRTRKFIIEPGTIVFWNSLTFHGVTENTSKRVQQGLYIGFQSKINRELYSERAEVEEVTDRYNTWRKGVAPKLFPSCDKVHLVPFKFTNFPHLMASYLKKVDPLSPKFDFTYRAIASGSNKGVMTPNLKEIPDADYIPFPLSQRAREMLVGAENVHRFDFSLA